MTPAVRAAKHAALGVVSHDLEAATEANLEAFEETGSAGAGETCEDCGRPLVVDAYGTWYGSPSIRDIRVAYYTCECRHG